MREAALAAAAVALLSSSACTVGPDYRRPTSDIPEAFRFQVKDASDVANAQWWRQFDDPPLDTLIDTALSRNWNLQTAAGQVEQAAAILTQARSGALPQIGYTGSAQRQRVPVSTIPLPAGVSNPHNLFEAILSSSWEIDLWGRVRRQAEAAQANLVGAEEARRGVVLSLVASVAITYLQLRTLDEQLDIANEALKVYGDTLQLFQNRFKYGEVSMLNVEQARAQYEGAAATIPQLELQIGQTEDALSVLMGNDPAAIPRGKLLNEMSLPHVPAALPSQLLERRPDIAQAEQTLIAANAQVGAAEALYFPQISLTGAFGWVSKQLGDLFEGPARLWTFGGSFTGPIYTGGAISGQVSEADAVRKQALANYQQTIRSAFAQVSDALISYQKGLEQLAAEEKLVAALRENVRLATLQFNEGYEAYLTVLIAERDFYAAQANVAQVRANAYASLVNIYQSLGGGWVTDAAKLAPQPAAQPAFPFP